MNNCSKSALLHRNFVDLAVFLHFQRIWIFLNTSVKFRIFSFKIQWDLAIFMQMLRRFEWIIYSFYSFLPKLWRVFCWNFEFWAVQKQINLLDLEKCCKMSIWLQKSVSIQPRTRLSKFGENESIIQSTPRQMVELWNKLECPRNLQPRYV